MEDGAQPIVPKPPTVVKPSEKIAANRRALSVLLRQVSNDGSSSVNDLSSTDDGHGGRAPRRAHRTVGLLREMTKIKTLEELLEHESQYRGIIESNQTRQRASITTQKYGVITVIEEQAVVHDAEQSKRHFVELDEAHSRLKHLSLLQLITEEFSQRTRVERQHPPQCFVDSYVDIQLRLLRQRERVERSDLLEPMYSLETLEAFHRYLMEQEYWMEWAGSLREVIAKKMNSERSFLEAQKEERATCELQEYVHRDGLESVMHSQYVLFVGQCRRDLRYLEHNDVQKVEERKRAAIARDEERWFHTIAEESVRVRRAVSGTIEASKIGFSELQWRNVIESEASSAFREVMTACLRGWHAVHQTSMNRTEVFSSTIRSEQLRRVDVEDSFRASMNALLRRALEEHQFVAHRDWERTHVKESYLDGRVAIWKQQEGLIDTMYQQHQRQVRLLRLTSKSVVLESVEAAKRDLIVVEQWKVFLLFYLWSSVQRYKILSVTTAAAIEKEEQEAWSSLQKRFDAGALVIHTNPQYRMVEDEDAQRDVLNDQELDARLFLYRNFKAGRRDITKAVVEVGSLLVTSSEDTARRRIESQALYGRIAIQHAALLSACGAEKNDTIGKSEALERRLIYARILDYVRNLFREDIEYEQEGAFHDMEQHKLLDEELQTRVAMLGEEDERSAFLFKMSDAKHYRLAHLMREEMEQRTSILAAADVGFNALSTKIACSSFGSSSPSLFFSTLQDRALLRQLRMYDAKSFMEDLEKETQQVLCADEPSRRRLMVMSEFHQRSELTMIHHEAVSRNVIALQEEREAKSVMDAAFRLLSRDVAHHEHIAVREVGNVEAVARNNADVEERVQLLRLLETQEEQYRVAEQQIRLRMLLDEGPLLREYFRQAEEFASSEDIQRDTIRCLWIAESAVQRTAELERQQREAEMQAALYQQQVEETAASTEHSETTAQAESPHADEEPPVMEAYTIMSPPAKMKAPKRAQVFDVVLHSVQLSTLTKAIAASGGPFMLQASSNMEEAALQWTTVPYDETQHIAIGSKTLKVLQPVDTAACRWEVEGEVGVSVSLQVLLGGEPILSGLRHVPWSECVETTNDGLITLPLITEHAGMASGKATLLIEIR
ncbi:Hypothetical protein, putative [Bodo saltans]|uniref:Uncharacterized protein n=1 Tax=Bodo saltans TaxID=75058 RepID=A0A0S4JIJ8_BODSA|nr:Hypothetical protein, putative [Bodo saltans]|eukprot:CUG91276.1 Hypothetical protein, putative [Bodo saltans]